MNGKFTLKKQKLANGSYYSRKSVDYKKICNFNIKKHTLSFHNKIRSLIFPPYQIPIINGVKVAKSIYKNKKIYLIESNGNKYK